MTEITRVQEPRVRVVFPNDFPEAQLRGSQRMVDMADILRDDDHPATISDVTLLERLANHFDLEGPARTYMASRFQPFRPETGNIVVSAKAEFGGWYENWSL